MPSVNRDGLSVYVPTYPAGFRCPECAAQLRQVLTSGDAGGSEPRLQPCACGYDSSQSVNRSPIPIH